MDCEFRGMILRQAAFSGSLVAAALSLSASASASSVVPMTVPMLADHAGQVFWGQVTEVRSYWTDEPRRIESQVTFTSVTYLKGALAGADDRFTLTVPGGKIGRLEMRIEGAPRFAVDESWILFVLPTYKTFPVVGLSQGALRIAAGPDGVERVYRAGHPVVGLDEEGFVQVAGIEAQAALAAEALPYERFVEQLAPILAASRDHGLTEPAGRRHRVRYTPRPLRALVP